MSADGPLFFASGADFRRWLEQNHETARELRVGFHKRDTGRPSMTWPESVDEALFFGWIDGVRRSVDASSYEIRFTPRQPKSIWSTKNIKRAQELIAEGRMRPAGRAAFEARREDLVRRCSFEQADPALGPEYERRLEALFTAILGTQEPARPQPADEGGIVAGTVVENSSPVQLDLESLRKHTVIFAGSGSGKTVLLQQMAQGIAEFAIQRFDRLLQRFQPSEGIAQLVLPTL